MEPIFALDVSIRKLKVIESENEDCNFMQLRTPLTQYRADEDGVIDYLLDNGAYSCFEEGKWLRMTTQGINDTHCIGIVMPDIVGDWTRTRLMFDQYKRWVPREKRFIVLQDGCTTSGGRIPWDEIVGVFLGGSTAYKYSEAAWLLLKEAKARGKHVHIGRVNTPLRLIYFEGMMDSFDGSGISMFDDMLNACLDTVRQLRSTKQLRLDCYE